MTRSIRPWQGDGLLVGQSAVSPSMYTVRAEKSTTWQHPATKQHPASHRQRGRQPVSASLTRTTRRGFDMIKSHLRSNRSSMQGAWARGTGYGSGSVRGTTQLDPRATEKLQAARDREILAVLDHLYNGVAGAVFWWV